MKKTLPQLKKELQRLVNKFCKLRDVTDGGANCISCGKWYPVEKLDGGHFLPSTYSFSRFDERNINAQCRYYCNHMKRGNTIEYRPRLIEKIGKEQVEYLEQHRHDTVKWDRSELEEKIAHYKQKLKEMV